jgi:protein XagA
MTIGDPEFFARGAAPLSLSAPLVLSLALAPAPAAAGAWTPEAGHGEVIVTTVFDQSNAGFDQAGRFMPTPKYRSWQASVYLDYGLADWLAVTVKPSLQSSTLGAPDNQKFNGLGDSEIGARARIWQSDVSVISLQALARVPGTGGAANSSLSGSRNTDVDLRLLGGKNIWLGALPGFIDVSLGYRARGGPAPNEGRADLSLGVYVRDDLMVLAQSFNVVSAASNSPAYPRWAQAKAQLSLVYAVNGDWRAQVGGFTTLAGVNAYREYGALVALWRRF